MDALLLNHRFETRFTQALSGKSIESVTFQSLSARLRRHYFVASELHDTSGEPTPFESSLIRPLDWTIVASLPQTRTYRWLRDEADTDPKGQTIDAVFMRSPLVGNVPLPASFPVIGNHSRKDQDQARRFRIRFLRLSAEMKALSLISGELNGGSLYKDFQSKPDLAQEKLVRLKRYYASTLDRIKDTIGETNSDDLSALVLQALRSEGHLTQDKLRTIIDVSTNAVGERLVEKSITTIFAKNLEFNQGDNMSKYTFNAPAQGQFGDGGTANFAENLIQGKASQSEMSALADELGQVLEALERDEDQSDEAAVAIASVKAAKNAAENGDQSKVMGFLKSAGAWTLEKSAAIGVPVAIAALKKAVGA
ncbi:hypothetical protein [Roseovarius sp. Pro17]|uniref:hypothetical protein n=1 Tax=Roseovarius sp. Pro17 TaxID=3108175 RepID=UPI002D77F409|nr:hypothetical protein [Roseovarius sp. Pro17]